MIQKPVSRHTVIEHKATSYLLDVLPDPLGESSAILRVCITKMEVDATDTHELMSGGEETNDEASANILPKLSAVVIIDTVRQLLHFDIAQVKRT